MPNKKKQAKSSKRTRAMTPVTLKSASWGDAKIASLSVTVQSGLGYSVIQLRHNAQNSFSVFRRAMLNSPAAVKTSLKPMRLYGRFAERSRRSKIAKA